MIIQCVESCSVRAVCGDRIAVNRVGVLNEFPRISYAKSNSFRVVNKEVTGAQQLLTILLSLTRNLKSSTRKLISLELVEHFL